MAKHEQRSNTDQMNDVARIRNGLNIRRPKKKTNVVNDKLIKACMSRFNSGVYSFSQLRLILWAHTHTEALWPTEDSSSSSSSDEAEETQVTTATATTTTTSSASNRTRQCPLHPQWTPRTRCPCISPGESCEVCLMTPRHAFALVPCGHALWKSVADVPCYLQRAVIIIQRVADINQSSHMFYNTL